MSDIFDAICSKLGTDTLWRLFPCHSGVCRSQELPPDRHSLITHQLHSNHSTRGHKLHQVTAKWGSHRIINMSGIPLSSRETVLTSFKCHYNVIRIIVTGSVKDRGCTLHVP